MEDNFLNKSKSNSYEITNEFSDFADKEIRKTIINLLHYLTLTSVSIRSKQTYNINLSYKVFKVASYTIKLSNNNYPAGFFQISNPFDFSGSRIWTTYKSKGKFWTNIETIIKAQIHPLVLYFFLIQNYERAYIMIKQEKRFQEDEVLNSFIDIDLDLEEVENNILNEFNKIFTKE